MWHVREVHLSCGSSVLITALRLAKTTIPKCFRRLSLDSATLFLIPARSEIFDVALFESAGGTAAGYLLSLLRG
jgi:hypothetical protein